MDQFEEKYFTKISKEDRDKVKQWLKGQHFRWKKEREFLELVKQAVRKINYDYWIAVEEPTVSFEKIFYGENESAEVGRTCEEWVRMAIAYNPDRKSRLALVHELILWYALGIVNGTETYDDKKLAHKLVTLKDKFILIGPVYKGCENDSCVVDVCDNVHPQCVLHLAKGAVVLTK